jgi:hypothetical protein
MAWRQGEQLDDSGSLSQVSRICRDFAPSDRDAEASQELLS